MLITNQIVANPDGMSYAHDATKPIGGNIVAHANIKQASVEKGTRGESDLTVYDSPTDAILYEAIRSERLFLKQWAHMVVHIPWKSSSCPIY